MMSNPARILFTLLLGAVAVISPSRIDAQSSAFQVEEATIADVHRAIQDGRISCVELIQAYLDRAKAYNGVSNQLNRGSERLILKAASAYEAASKRRVPPPAFGPLPTPASRRAPSR